jgi:hypothetical protein
MDSTLGPDERPDDSTSLFSFFLIRTPRKRPFIEI